MVKVSVLLPVYNTNAAHLKSAIDSVLHQTFTDFELIIYNDASTENRVEKTVKSYNDSRIRYISGEKNLGISRVRNKLIDLSEGEYLAVMDHDDLFLPQKLEKQINLMDKNPDIGVCGTAYKKFGNLLKRKTVVFPQTHKEIRAALFFKNVIHHPSCVMRKKNLIENDIRYDENYISANDRKLFMDIAEVGKAFNIQEPLCKYRMHKNMTSQAKRKEIVNQQKLLRKDFLNRMGGVLSPAEEDILNDYVLKGRAKIRQYDRLVEIESVLTKLSLANDRSSYFDKEIFNKSCAKYLIKRCLNAAFYGKISSKALLRDTILPVSGQKNPFFLKMVNYFK